MDASEEGKTTNDDRAGSRCAIAMHASSRGDTDALPRGRPMLPDSEAEIERRYPLGTLSIAVRLTDRRA